MMVEDAKRLPRHVIVSRMKAVRVRQQDIAARVGCSIAYVSATIRRATPPNNPMHGRVWQEIAKVLA